MTSPPIHAKSLLQRILLGLGRTLKAAWLLVGLTLVLLVILELGCRLAALLPGGGPAASPNYFLKVDSYKGQPWLDDYYQEFTAAFNTTWRSYVYWRRKPIAGKYVNVDDRNHRRTMQPAPAASDTRPPVKIFMFGGSTMWGEGVRDAYTIASQLAQTLAEAKIPAVVTNFGETGYVSTQEVIELLRQLQAGQVPDVAIFYDGVNDVYAAYQSGVAGIPQNEWKRQTEYNLTNRYNQMRRLFLQQTLDRFCLGSKLKALAQRLQPAAGSRTLPEGLAEEIVQTYLANVKTIDALGRAFGFETLFYWQPVIYFKPTVSEFEEYFTREKPMEAIYRKTYDLIKTQAVQLQPYQFHDISAIFADTTEPLYIDYCHVNETGNGIIARRMARDVTALLSRGKPAPTVRQYRQGG